MKMYFSSALNEEIYIDFSFTQVLNYSNFDMYTFQNITISATTIEYTMDMFNVTYTNLTASAYRIILKPKTYIFLYNATFTVITME